VHIAGVSQMMIALACLSIAIMVGVVTGILLQIRRN
jgi:hypothetical protein